MNHNLRGFVALCECLLFALLMPCFAAPETTSNWTSLNRRVFFPVNEPVQLDENILLLRRGHHDYTIFLPSDYLQHPSRKYPLALIAAPLTDEHRQNLADLFCAHEWAMLHLEITESSSPEQVLAGLIVSYRDAQKRYPLLPNTQLLAGYKTGAEMGAFFAATRRGFAAWIGDDGLFPQDTQNGNTWITTSLKNHTDLLLYVIQRGDENATIEAFSEALPEGMSLQTVSVAATNAPLPTPQLATALAWVRQQLLFEQPATGRHYYYAETEYNRLRNQLARATGKERETILSEMTQLNERYHFETEPEIHDQQN